MLRNFLAIVSLASLVVSPAQAARKVKAQKGVSQRARALAKRRTELQLRTPEQTKKPARWGASPFVTTRSLRVWMQKRGLADGRFQLVTKTMANGVIRNIMQVPSQHLNAFADRFSTRQNIIGLISVRESTTLGHTVLRLGRKTIEIRDEALSKRNKRFPEWGKEKWYAHEGAVYSSGVVVTERLIQLKPHEMRALLKLVDRKKKQQKEWGQVDPWEGNCTSCWLMNPVGTRGVTIAELAGITNSTHSAWSFEEAHTEGTDRVIGTVIHLPDGKSHPGFGDRLKDINENRKKYPPRYSHDMQK